MNQIRQIQALNKREIEAGVSTSASWHADYRDTAYVYIGGLPYDLSEGDIVTIFSQYGEPVHINLVRDKETGKSKGFAFLKYEDQRSTDLAVDNLGGATILGRTIRVDHSRYKRKDDEEIYDNTRGVAEEDDAPDQENDDRRGRRGTPEEQRPLLPEEKELAELMRDHDDDDPMKEYLVQEKREEVSRAIKKYEAEHKKERKHKHRHRHRHSHKHEDDHSSKRAAGDREDGRLHEKKDRKDRESPASRENRDHRSRDHDHRNRYRDRSSSRDRSDRHPRK